MKKENDGEEKSFLQKMMEGGGGSEEGRGRGRGSGNEGSRGKKKEEEPLDPSLLLDWLKENEVMAKLFVPSSHPEIIQQGIDIPLFIAQHGQLK